jgi:cobalt-precorrin 5A hydrolase/precorrin-3B C17-methyltransferase
MTGIVYGLGIGPGDPDLITVKAKDILTRVPVIAYPAPQGGESLVRTIAARHLPPGCKEIVMPMPTAADSLPAGDLYRQYAAEIAGHLDAGLDVAVLCEGDPFLYGSFLYVFELLAGHYRTIVVPGVSSLGAVAASAGLPLASRNDVLTILPALLPEAELARRLAASDSAAILKVGRHLPKVRRVLRRLGLEARSYYVERASMPTERCLPLAELGEEAAPYFSAVLVRGGRETGRPERSPQPPPGSALVVITADGLDAARRVQPVLPQSCIHGLAARVPEADVGFSDVALHLQSLFAARVPIVAFCAAGILVRALAPLLADKSRESPVVAVAEDLSVAIPLLGGHHGANRLAATIAAATGAVAALTTASDLRHGVAVDDPPTGWRIANPQAAKAISAALLAGEPVALRVEAGDAGWLRGSSLPFAATADRALVVTGRAVANPGDDLILHPPVLAVGVGCERGANPEEVIEMVQGTLRSHGLAAGAVACVATIELKADEEAVHRVARALGVPARFFSAAELEAETPRLAHPSEAVFRQVGCHGVAEAAALAAAGAEATLAVAKRRSSRATCAIARAVRDIDARVVGRPRGELAIVGIGPGDPDWRTAEASRALAQASDVVGYGLYLDLIADAVAGKVRHAWPLGEEEARVRGALDLAAEGRSVALVSSGDAGIYGLASLVFELIDRDGSAAWKRLAITVAPGVSALQAAAARAGAPLGHDFCAISLSDLLTPWPEIKRRLEAAAAGDFVVALYNPVSRRRRDQLIVARDLLLAKRPAATPVVVARNLGRDGETIRLVRLDQLTAADVDMLTVLLIGSSRTRWVEWGSRRWVYTPRGYARKIGAAGAFPPAREPRR